MVPRDRKREPAVKMGKRRGADEDFEKKVRALKKTA